MDMRYATTAFAVMLAVAAAPAGAQQKPAPGPTAMARATALTDEVNATFNKKDPAAVAALFTTDALLVGPDGTRVQGRKALTAYFTTTFGFWGNFTYKAEVKEAHPIGSGMWADVTSTIQTSGPAGTLKSHLADIIVPVGKGWKLRFVSVGPDAAPPGMPPPK
jgi:ketosteroid isomerase-like protein